MKQNIFKGLKSFLLLWSSQAVSALGTSMTSYALIIWTYARQGTASSVTLLSFFTFLPTIALRFVTGAIADRWNKKRIMLAADAAAACGTAVIFALYSQNALQVWHLYVINTLLSFMDAFQSPAAHVATSLMVPREQYARVSGLQSLSGAAVSIIAPALGSVLLAAGGVSYTAGGLIYALKKPNLFRKFGFHELFHCFVLLGSLLHYLVLVLYVLE